MEASVLRTFPGKDIADPVGTMCDLTSEALQRIDPRFRIAVAREGKTTTYIYEAIEPVSCEFSVKPEFANEFQEKYEAFVHHGDDLSIAADAVSFQGSPLFERFPQRGGAFKMSQAIDRPASLIIELIDQNSLKNDFLAELPGRITHGKVSFNFHGVVFGGLLAIQLRAIPDGKTSVTVNVNFEKWDGKDINALPYFDRMWAYFKQVVDGGLVSMRLEIEGKTITTFNGKFPPEAATSICILQYIRNARCVASALKRPVLFHSNAKISADHYEEVQDLYARLQVASPLDLARNASFTLSPIEGETERECVERIKSDVFGVVSVGLPIYDWTLFGQEMPPAVMEMTYSAARFNPLGGQSNGNVGVEIIADTESTIQCCLKLAEPV